MKKDKQEEGGVGRKHVGEISEARLEETFDLINKELKKINKDGELPAGVILTGGGAKLPGVVELAKKQLRLPVIVGLTGQSSARTQHVHLPAIPIYPVVASSVSEILPGSSRSVNKYARQVFENDIANTIRTVVK